MEQRLFWTGRHNLKKILDVVLVAAVLQGIAWLSIANAQSHKCRVTTAGNHTQQGTARLTELPIAHNSTTYILTSQPLIAPCSTARPTTLEFRASGVCTLQLSVWRGRLASHTTLIAVSDRIAPVCTGDSCVQNVVNLTFTSQGGANLDWAKVFQDTGTGTSAATYIGLTIHSQNGCKPLSTRRVSSGVGRVLTHTGDRITQHLGSVPTTEASSDMPSFVLTLLLITRETGIADGSSGDGEAIPSADTIQAPATTATMMRSQPSPNSRATFPGESNPSRQNITMVTTANKQFQRTTSQSVSTESSGLIRLLIGLVIFFSVTTGICSTLALQRYMRSSSAPESVTDYTKGVAKRFQARLSSAAGSSVTSTQQLTGLSAYSSCAESDAAASHHATQRASFQTLDGSLHTCAQQYHPSADDIPTVHVRNSSGSIAELTSETAPTKPPSVSADDTGAPSVSIAVPMATVTRDSTTTITGTTTNDGGDYNLPFETLAFIRKSFKRRKCSLPDKPERPTASPSTPGELYAKIDDVIAKSDQSANCSSQPDNAVTCPTPSGDIITCHSLSDDIFVSHSQPSDIITCHSQPGNIVTDSPQEHPTPATKPSSICLCPTSGCCEGNSCVSLCTENSIPLAVANSPEQSMPTNRILNSGGSC